MGDNTPKELPSALTFRIKLSVKERLNVEGLLPPKGDRTTMSLVEDILAKVEVKQKEREEIGLAPRFDDKGNQIGWGWLPEKEKDKVVEFTNAELGFLKRQADVFDKNKDITLSMYGLIKKLDDIRVSDEIAKRRAEQ